VVTEADVAAVLQRRGPQHARAIAGFLRPKHGTVARKDVNSILYAGKGRVFARSDDERPIWSLIGGHGHLDPVASDAHDGDLQPMERVDPVVTRRERAPHAAPRTRVPAATRQAEDDA